MSSAPLATREHLVRRGLWLNYATIGYNVLEALVSLGAGIAAGSIALVGFGVDSAIEVTASLIAQWRLRSDADTDGRERVERLTMLLVGWCFVALAGYVLLESARTLWLHEHPERSVPGIVILVLSVLVMPPLARAKRRVARELRSEALEAESVQTSLCAWLSAIALGGVALNALAGWWWADPVAALLMVPIILNEGLERVRGESDD